MLKVWFSGLPRGEKGKKCTKLTKISVCCTLYFRNHTSYYLYLRYTCMYKRIISPDILFIFFKILIFGIIMGMGVVKRQKMAQNDKKFCLSHFLSQKPYIIWLWFLVQMCKMIISLQQVFLFFKILIFRVFRGVKWQKMA